ncbi:ExeA family protein [Catenovulum maritimum]|uniref:Peptidase C39 domain-containing protein n=1 Tax=Catenovulum maritimum TaxID=1513271 RepID=A0A0J8H0B4_9ALTE|nr:AAA family ATPase [Catenovulum maritimum]KMT66458.1 hypothetical protein XM47_02630 [Catenovulum maritimum]
MYKGFFGLTEIPFSIAPNPDFLFMSERHKEALAHLTFGLNETGGFVLLTGEVGTGKTTISRCLLDNIPDKTNVAFVLNPSLTEQELLATICDEFKLDYDKNNLSIKALNDTIKAFLLSNHAEGKNALLMIDEAQHLRPEVLEQLRLLTNLETNTKKLLQVILIGQPELQQLLKRQELRQLAQRITARYHLLPLNKHQVAEYIRHRLKIAGCNKALFTKSAINEIHKISQGIPRLINLLCDRALLGAFVKQQQVIDKKIVLIAAKESIDYQDPQQSLLTKVNLLAATVSFICLLVVYFVINTQSNESMEAKTLSISSTDVEVKAKQDDLESEQLNIQTQHIVDLIPEQDLLTNLSNLSNKWLVELDIAAEQPCLDLIEYGLACYEFNGSLKQLNILNLPSILELYSHDGRSFYSLYLGSNNRNKLILDTSEKQIEIEQTTLDKYWRGKALIVWQPPAENIINIDADSDIELIQWLETALSVELNQLRRKVSFFDKPLQLKLNQFQNKLGLSLTPYADTMSLIALQQKFVSSSPKLLGPK